ncbi:MAG: GCN5-related N-acetyltransferase [Herbinix sp.]|jgi:GNAT superfamily N-acetyltransferase|nr:GCN5-related N-acetyltransferase [Herbinix sp.]
MIFETKDFFIDKVDIKDVEDIVMVYNSHPHFLMNHMEVNEINKEWLLEELDAMKNIDFNSTKVVEKASGKLVGIIDYKIEEETYLSLLMIHNDCLNKGFGKVIYQAFEEYIKLEQSKFIRIDVVTDYNDRVLSFWTNNGFKKIETIELNWTGKVLPAVIMKKSL